MPEIELSGLDGSNLLAYMAALGTLRVLSSRGELAAQMRWEEKGFWRPIVRCELETPEALVAKLASLVSGRNTLSSACQIGKDLTFTQQQYREVLETGVHRGDRGREHADFLCAFGSDAFATGPKMVMSDTEFRTMSGAGHQHFLGFMQELAEGTEAEHVRRALLQPWDYQDDRPSLRWDAADYRPHALRAEDPSGDPIRTMRGANRLAIEALPLFPTAPGTRDLFTTAFAKRDGATQISWPIWEDLLDWRTVGSLLAMEEVQNADLADTRNTLMRRGVAQVFRSMRFTEGKYRNFSPAKPLL